MGIINKVEYLFDKEEKITKLFSLVGYYKMSLGLELHNKLNKYFPQLFKERVILMGNAEIVRNSIYIEVQYIDEFIQTGKDFIIALNKEKRYFYFFINKVKKNLRNWEKYIDEGNRMPSGAVVYFLPFEELEECTEVFI